MVTANRGRVGLRGTTILSCSVTRTNPAIDGTYVWSSVNAGTIAETSNTLVVNVLTKQEFDTYTCMVTNTAGVSGTGSLTVEQGCK